MEIRVNFILKRYPIFYKYYNNIKLELNLFNSTVRRPMQKQTLIVSPYTIGRWVYENTEEAEELIAKQLQRTLPMTQREYMEIPDMIGGKLPTTIREKCQNLVRQRAIDYELDFIEDEEWEQELREDVDERLTQDIEIMMPLVKLLRTEERIQEVVILIEQFYISWTRRAKRYI